MTDLLTVLWESLSPHPTAYVVNSVVDAKAWMAEQTMGMHDHLKAHQFKFVMKRGQTLMYYKEWSSDKLWLPDAGLCILPDGNQVPKC